MSKRKATPEDILVGFATVGDLEQVKSLARTMNTILDVRLKASGANAETPRRKRSDAGQKRKTDAAAATSQSLELA